MGSRPAPRSAVRARTSASARPDSPFAVVMSWMNVPCRRGPGTWAERTYRAPPAPPIRGRARPPRPSRRRAGRRGRRRRPRRPGRPRGTRRTARSGRTCPGEASGGVQCGDLRALELEPEAPRVGPLPARSPGSTPSRSGSCGVVASASSSGASTRPGVRSSPAKRSRSSSVDRAPWAGGAGDRGGGHPERLEHGLPRVVGERAPRTRSATSCAEHLEGGVAVDAPPARRA